MFKKLHEKKLDSNFISALKEKTYINDIENWTLIYDDMISNLDHNGNFSLDSLYVLSSDKLDKVVIFLSESDNSLLINQISLNLDFNDFFTTNLDNFNKFNLEHIYNNVNFFKKTVLFDNLNNKLIEKLIIKSSKI